MVWVKVLVKVSKAKCGVCRKERLLPAEGISGYVEEAGCVEVGVGRTLKAGDGVGVGSGGSRDSAGNVAVISRDWFHKAGDKASSSNRK